MAILRILWNLVLLMKPSDALQNDSIFHIKNTPQNNYRLGNHKFVTYGIPIPLFLIYMASKARRFNQVFHTLRRFVYANTYVGIHVSFHTILKTVDLTGGNWQQWKRVFLTCPCHEIYRDEAVDLKSCKNTWKITIFVKMWNLGQYRENFTFCQ